MNTVERISVLATVAISTTVVGPAPVSAASNQVSGIGVFVTTGTTCPGPPEGYDDFRSYPPILLTGSLEGCWYTKIDSLKDNGAPSGIYLESGREVFVGSLDGGPIGLFATTYKFESKWAPDVSTGTEVRGRCQHPIIVGTGIGGFDGATGRLDFKDIVANGSYVYRGHVSVP
jgi:hypothetical protein